LIATVAELRRTRRELARLAVLQERDRFARDLHDLLGHTLSVIVVKAEAVRRLAPLDSAAAAVHAADIETIGREALADVRRAADGYRGAGLDRELTRGQAALAAAGVSLAMKRPSDEPLPDDIDVLLGWAVREGVTNVVRHTQAQHCTITVRRLARSVELIIEDDGTAKSPSPEPPATEPPTMAPSSGLPGLGERVAAAGGTVTAMPTEQGFRITVDVPFAGTR
jgi:two-component system sensor histidine kinase DesK